MELQWNFRKIDLWQRAMHVLYRARAETEAEEASFFLSWQECYNAALDTSWPCTLDVFSSMLHSRRGQAHSQRL